jgi:hypothetical protein
MSKYTVIFIIVIFGFMCISEAMTATAQDYINQTNSTKSDKQTIIVTWLETNNTKRGSSAHTVISISSEDFWKIFGPLLGTIK